MRKLKELIQSPSALQIIIDSENFISIMNQIKLRTIFLQVIYFVLFFSCISSKCRNTFELNYSDDVLWTNNCASWMYHKTEMLFFTASSSMFHNQYHQSFMPGPSTSTATMLPTHGQMMVPPSGNWNLGFKPLARKWWTQNVYLYLIRSKFIFRPFKLI